MAKFVMECPNCGRYATAKSGLFARRRIDCECGHRIHIKTERLTTRTCPHCGNTFAYDQKDGIKTKCPVCKNKLLTTDDNNKTVEIICSQCGVHIQTVKGAETATCPVCDHVNKVTEQLVQERIKREGLASIIKYEGDNDALVWKHPIEDFNFGSQLIVHESQEAIFFRDGEALDLFGAGRYTLETNQLPILEKAYKLPTDSETTFHSEVYFINTNTQMGIKWGTDTKVRMFDPMSGMHVELGASGEFNIRVLNSRKLLVKLIGTADGLSNEQLVGNGKKAFFRSLIMTQVKSFLASSIRENHISVLAIDEHLMQLSDALKDVINHRLLEYGLEMTDFFISRVVTPDEDPNFRKMKEQYAEQYLGVREEQIRKQIAKAEAERKAVEAQTEAQIKIISAQGEAEALKLKAFAEAEAYKAQAFAEAEEMRAKGYTYQQETARQVSLQAMQNGITGNGGGEGGGSNGILGSIGDIAGLGMTLGAVGGIVNMTKDVLTPIMDTTSQMSQAVGTVMTNSWNCMSCGQQNIKSNFCPECGAKRPASTWACPNCGATELKTNFCPNCGQKKG